MPIYQYECQNCESAFEIQQSYDSSSKKKCPDCKKYKLLRVLSVPHVYVIQEPTTLGQLADRNTKEMGQYKLDLKNRQELEYKDIKSRQLQKKLPPGMKRINTKSKAPFWRPGTTKPNSKLNKLSTAMKKQYIEQGTTYGQI